MDKEQKLKETNEVKQVERNVNITLKNEEEKGEEIVISFSAFVAQLKRFVLLWIVLALVIAILVPVFSILTASDQHKNLTALVSFNYDGIEQGLAPDGTSFDPNTLKSPAVIESAL
ncbi:MAG: hypothetical protein IJ595_05255, partial [Oscillospiraceae bacterium]|nr:hypothetical protein [Oscillospiraceae bacterium]